MPINPFAIHNPKMFTNHLAKTSSIVLAADTNILFQLNSQFKNMSHKFRVLSFKHRDIPTSDPFSLDKEKFEHIDVYISNFTTLRHSLTGRNEQTLLKVIVDNRSKMVLGIHMVGSEAGEIIQGLAVGMKMGMSKDDLDSTIGIHPTTAEEFVTMREKTR